jgi:hypothetical protein
LAPATESYFLLSAFANMAISRDIVSERDVIETATLDIFHAGFVNESTAEHCCKNARDLLANIALKHTSIMSFVLGQLENELIMTAVGMVQISALWVNVTE